MSGSQKGSIILIVPPFQTTARPALGVSQLKANLEEQGFPTQIFYSHFHFAERIGLDLYEWIHSGTFNTLFGEYVFSDVLFRHADEALERYVMCVLAGTPEEDFLKRRFRQQSIAGVLRQLMQEASAFCDEVTAAICAQDPWMVGLTSSFQQNCSSLAIIRGLKQKRPHILTAMGGANCSGEMGEELFQRFPEIDYIGQEECDHSFVSLVRSLAEKKGIPAVPGFLSRAHDQSRSEAPLLEGEDLDRLPYPDFSDYFAQLTTLKDSHRVLPAVMMETSRGCWWGAKQHCTFCAFNGDRMRFRSKSPSRALEEMTALVQKHNVQRVAMADNILDMRYFKTFLPKLAERPLAGVFYETKANLSREKVSLLARSRVDAINPGIESLSDHTLRLLRKGTTKLKNIQLLKWCAEYGIWPGWNYLYGIPGEPEKELSDIAQQIETLHHLQYPQHTMTIRVERGSAYFNNPGKYGLEPVYPAEPYRHIYPFPEESLKRLAYCYKSEYFAGAARSKAFRNLKSILKRWERAYPDSYLLAIPRKKSLIILDTRPIAKKFWHRLVGPRRQVYECCDTARTVPRILTALGSIGESELESILASFVHAGLMIHVDGRYLSLAVNARPNCGKVVSVAPGGSVRHAPASGNGSNSMRRLVTFKLPPGRIAAALVRRASGAKRKISRKAIVHLANMLSGNHQGEP